MKKYFKINEISKLFDIGIDSLRYYEKIGLIKPKRGENNYRYYSTRDIYKLTIIKDLRKLNFSLSQIKGYISELSLENTYNMLNDQNKIIEEEINKLQKQQKLVKSQIYDLEKYKNIEINTFEIKKFNSRYAVELETNVKLDEEVDFSIRYLQKENNFKLHQFENYEIGASMSLDDIKNGVFGKYNSVFMVTEEKKKNVKEFLPSGNYLCYKYKGSYSNLRKYLNKFIDYEKENNLTLSNTIYEFYYIDTRYTGIEDEYLTELQVLIV